MRQADLTRALAKLQDENALEDQVLTEQQQHCYLFTESGYQRMLELNSPLTFGLARYQRLRRHAKGRLQAGVDAPVLARNERRQMAMA